MGFFDAFKAAFHLKASVNDSVEKSGARTSADPARQSLMDLDDQISHISKDPFIQDNFHASAGLALLTGMRRQWSLSNPPSDNALAFLEAAGQALLQPESVDLAQTAIDALRRIDDERSLRESALAIFECLTLDAQNSLPEESDAFDGHFDENMDESGPAAPTALDLINWNCELLYALLAISLSKLDEQSGALDGLSAGLARQGADRWMLSEYSNLASNAYPSAFSLMALAAKNNQWCESLLPSSGKLPTPMRAFIALASIEDQAMQSGSDRADENQIDPEQCCMDEIEDLREAALVLGAALSRLPQSEDFFLELSSRLNETAEETLSDHPLYRDRMAFSSRNASSLLLCWTLEGAVEAQPGLAASRDKSGQSIASHFNDSLTCAQPLDCLNKGWFSQDAYAQSIQSLARIVEIANDPFCIVPVNDPALRACHPSIKALIEKATFNGATLAGSNKQPDAARRL